MMSPAAAMVNERGADGVVAAGVAPATTKSSATAPTLARILTAQLSSPVVRSRRNRSISAAISSPLAISPEAS